MMKFLLLLLLSSACSNLHHRATSPSSSYLGDFIVSDDYRFNEKAIGGISGITQGEREGLYYAVNDDKGDFDRPKIYTLEISFDQSLQVKILNVIYLTDEKGKDFKVGEVDFEGIALTPDNNFLLSSEGNYGKQPFIEAKLFQFSKSGILLKSYNLPKEFRISGNTLPIQNNLGLESLCGSSDKSLFTTANEGLLTTDTQDLFNNPLQKYVRFVRYKRTDMEVESQFFYPIDYINAEGSPKNFGLVDLLCLQSNSYYALERIYLRKENKNHIRIYKTQPNSNSAAVKKSLILDLDQIANKISDGKGLDNFEGISYGPKLKDGSETILLVSDNNFSKTQRTIFLLLRAH